MNSSTKDIVKRQLIIIQLLLQGNYVSTKQIQSHLKDFGIETKLRTLQRDLVSLEEILPIECRKDDKPYSWRWQRLNNTIQHQLSVSQAIALRLVETELQDVIPTDLYERLQPLFIKSHLVTGLSQLNNLNQEVDCEVGNDSSVQQEQLDPIKFNATSLSPLKRLIMTLRSKHTQTKNSVKETIVKSSKSIDEHLPYQIDVKDEAVIMELKDNLLNNDFQNIAKLLNE